MKTNQFGSSQLFCFKVEKIKNNETLTKRF